MGLNFGQSLFPPRGERLVNYDYFDTANGVGYEIYYGSRGTSGAYIISPSIFYSEEIKTNINADVVLDTYGKWLDMDFDLTYNLPRNIKGDVIVNVPIGVKGTDDGDNRITFYAKVSVIHYDGTTETVLGTGQSIPFVSETLPTPRANAFVTAVRVNIPNVTHFKKGDILRFTIEGYAKSTVGNPENIYFAIGHDPMNRNDTLKERTSAPIKVLANYTDGTTYTHISTQMIFHVPYVLDI